MDSSVSVTDAILLGDEADRAVVIRSIEWLDYMLEHADDIQQACQLAAARRHLSNVLETEADYYGR